MEQATTFGDGVVQKDTFFSAKEKHSSDEVAEEEELELEVHRIRVRIRLRNLSASLLR